MKESDILINLNELELGTEEELTEEIIRKRWKELSKLYHPDTSASDIYIKSNKQAKINKAKEFLINNLSEINYYIRKINHRQTPEDLQREKAEFERQEQARKAEEERIKRATEENLKRAEEELRKARAERFKAEAERKKAEEANNNRYSNTNYQSNEDNYSHTTNYSNMPKQSTSDSTFNYHKSSSIKTIKKGPIIIVAVVIIFMVIAFLVGLGESGSISNFKQITNASELQNMSSDQNYQLKNDIDLTGVDFTPISTFNGTLDGNNHKILNLTITAFTTDYVGLFSETGENAKIKNLIIENINIESYNSAKALGGLCGNAKGTISNITITGNIKTSGVDNVGGIIGQTNYQTTIRDSSFNGTIVGNNYVGGIVGGNAPIDVANCKTDGTISGNSYAGGIYGGYKNSNGTSFSITNCENKSTVKSTNDYCGGIFGGIDCGSNWGAPSGNFSGLVNLGNIQGASYSGGIAGLIHLSSREPAIGGLNNKGDITGYNYTAGIIGKTDNQISLSSSFSEGKIVGHNYVGSIIGEGPYTTISSVTNNSEISGNSFVGGIAGLAKEINNCHNNAKISATGVSEGSIPWTALGGIAGACDIVKNCTNSGNIECNIGNAVGGIVGANASLYYDGEITNCENSGNIKVVNASSVGGIIGAFSHQTFKEIGLTVSGCKNSGTITCESGERIGGIVGYYLGDSTNISNKVKVTIASCFSLGDILCESCNYVGGILGNSQNGTTLIHTVTINAKIFGRQYNGSIIGYCKNFYDISDYESTFTIIKTGFESSDYRLNYIGDESYSPIIIK